MADAAAIRRLALAFPEAVEADHFGAPSFRIRGKIFATMRTEPPRLTVNLDPEDQANFAAAHGDVVSPVPGYWGRKGATYVDAAKADDALVETLLTLAWRRTAPRRLSANRP